MELRWVVWKVQQKVASMVVSLECYKVDMKVEKKEQCLAVQMAECWADQLAKHLADWWAALRVGLRATKKVVNLALCWVASTERKTVVQTATWKAVCWASWKVVSLELKMVGCSVYCSVEMSER